MCNKGLRQEIFTHRLLPQRYTEVNGHSCFPGDRLWNLGSGVPKMPSIVCSCRFLKSHVDITFGIGNNFKAKQNPPRNASIVSPSNESTSSLGLTLPLLPPLLIQVTSHFLSLLDLLLLCSPSVHICTPLGLCTYILKIITAPIT